MKTNTIAIGILASALLLGACSRSSHDNTPPGASGDTGQAAEPASSFIGAEVRKSIEQAKQELATKDIGVDDVHFSMGRVQAGKQPPPRDGSLPKAVITPQGALVIAGKPIEATPAQHALLMDYRQQIIGIADAGMDIGASGADVGVAAAKQAILGAFTGKSEKEIEASIKPQTDQIKAAALGLCKRLPDMLAAQQKLAAAMPAFRPYATMTPKDVDDCGKDKDGKKGFAVFSD